MRHNKKFLWVVLLFGIALSGLQAQNTMNLIEKSGTQTSYALSSIKKITFTEGNMMVIKKDGTTNAFSLLQIRSLLFDRAIAIEEVRFVEKGDLMFYPNPAKNQLTIQYESTTAEDVQIQIIDVLGKVVIRETFHTQTGTNRMSLSVDQLKQGLYLCRLYDNDKQIAGKFLKN